MLPLPALPLLPAPIKGDWLLPVKPLLCLPDAKRLAMYESTGSLDRWSEHLGKE